ncbi:clathrin-adaptor gamma chain [Reticulomyxa filosa]|uniref:Clathrin-adaptor gamma chain n=1 Tax=Reticulomyxa filosa TaxID=46433 RepID=X6NGU7_RETFI|nr:clathrin-adaptor gamma chain [Reticulomyxa filosa]|eukprot:ETO25133.1 clathrin-adaptor gamma chain [Reticulomyxa filosa]
MRKYIPNILSRLNLLLRSSYDPDHDIGGVTDPFLQVHLLTLLRTVTHTDKKMSEDVMDTLTQIATNTESNKNPGNSVLYECVRTIMCIETQSPVHRLAINILGKFLLNRDNNIRYVALNALCNAVTANNDAIQRHRNQIKECLKDADITIRTRALDLIYALTNEENIVDLVQDLLKFCDMSSNEPEFQQDLAAKICMVVERYAPNSRWHIDTVTQVMAKVGSLVMEDAITSLYVIIARTPELQMYSTYKLFAMVSQEELNSDPLRRLCAWCIGEYGTKLTTVEGAQEARIDENIRYVPFTQQQVLDCLKKIIEHTSSSETTKAVIEELLKKYNDSVAVELQQRSVEFTELLQKATNTVKQEVLKAMPAPQVQFEDTKSESKEVPSEDEKPPVAHESDSESESTEKQQTDSKKISSTKESPIFPDNPIVQPKPVDPFPDLISNLNNNQQDIIPSIVAFNKNGVDVTFHFAKLGYSSSSSLVTLQISNQLGITQVNAVFRNINAFSINDFSFMVAVPKYMALEIQPSTGKQLLALGQNYQSQRFRLTNHFHGQKPLVIKIQISYTDQTGNKVVETAQVANFPPNC